MVSNPGVIPVTTPVPGTTVARALLLLKAPPASASDKVIFDVTQTVEGPEIDDGVAVASTLTVALVV